MTLNYYSKEVYGQTMYYLATAGDRQMWRNISGKKTITTGDMDCLTALTGATFNRVFEADNV